MSEQTLLVTGAGGFIGGAVLAALDADYGDAWRVRAVVHHRHPPATRSIAVQTVRADLAEPGPLRGLCDGVHTVLHLATQIGGDPRLCRAVNEDGTARLLAEAQRAGVARIIQVSTTAVYGPGPHRGATEGELETVPVSATSLTRLRAEQAVRDAGGVVLRPPLVYGTGDVWAVPTLVRLLRQSGGLPGGGTARLSVIAVEDLARAAARLTVSPEVTGVFHACDPRPSTLRRIAAALTRELGVVLPTSAVSYQDALGRLGDSGLSERQLHMITADHWYTSHQLWARLGISPGPGLAARLRRHADWYRSVL
ncbi:NAD-dependent epimerase/dehydratase family protein [Catellatospora tritici]|uniref:NAD-dependent epimerase/dehydratase family protein n=1 Tax=Catellatospora tritici TaxID=2851566 RepID=UPI001C2D858D|nr:NAD(P)-dependent oxidoreductase [Catellatospora tritici]MBV1855605.1 NAD(P)-dependent oxidoreductase [Catellatospora tritici]